MDPPPPPPPPHGSNGPSGSGLPHAKYDIFVIPPHSSGSGFLYLPSLQPHRNSFLAGVACTLGAVAIWIIVFPVLREWASTMAASGGMGMMVMMGGVGVVGWAWGKTQFDSGPDRSGGGAGSAGGSAGASNGYAGASASAHAGVPPPQQEMPRSWPGGPNANAGQQPKYTWQRQKEGEGTSPKGAWEKAREEARKKEEERKRMEELRKKAEELTKKKEEEEKARVQQREKEARERRVREAREAREKEAREKEAREKEAKEKLRTAPPDKPGSPRKHQQPTARTEADEDAYSYRPYDKPKTPTHKTKSASSVYSESSYAASHSTSRTTPPPSHRGPYSTKDPDKIVIKAVYSFNNAFNNLPIAQLVSGTGSVTDGLILRITTEGLFIDDDVRGVPQREWDVKAWTMKLVESGDFKGLHVLRATIRDQEGKRYVFVIQEEEGWKVAIGLQRLRRGTQVRALGVSGLPLNETKAILTNMGFI